MYTLRKLTREGSLNTVYSKTPNTVYSNEAQMEVNGGNMATLVSNDHQVMQKRLVGRFSFRREAIKCILLKMSMLT